MKLIRSGEELPEDREAEKKNDVFSKNEKYPEIKKTALFTFDDSKTKLEDDKYFLWVTIRIGYHFWQSAVPLVFRGERYFIYRRHYLSSVRGVFVGY